MSGILASVLLAVHPALFFGPGDVPALRQAAASTHKAIASNITTVLDAHLADPAPTPADYDDVRFHGNAVAVWAFGYAITGNAAYADKARQLLLTYAGWSDWGFGEAASLGEPDINTGHMLTGVALAYDWVWPVLSDADRATVAQRLGVEAQKMADGLPNAWYRDEYVQNHNWISTAGLGLAALALSGEDARAAGWLQLAQDDLSKLALVLDPIADGSFHEGLPYEGYGLSMSLPFWAALAHAGSDYTSLGILKGFGKWWLYAQLPDDARQVIVPYGDFTGWPTQATTMLLRYTASRFRDPLAESAAQRWLAAGSRGTFLPERFYDAFELLFYDPSVAAADPHAQPLEAGFSDLGAAVLHSSWDAGDLAVGFKAGPYGGRANFDRVKAGGAPGGYLSWGHDHNDDMSFWLFGNGVWLAPEAMGYTAGVNTGVADAANATAYHNGLLVDGAGQLGDVRASDSNWGNPWFFQRDAGLLVQPAGTAHYSIAGGRGASLFDAALGLTRWDRVIALAKGRYALVRDDIAASAPHAFDWVCHFADGVSADPAGGWVQGTAKAGQSLGVRVISPASWTASTGTQTASLMNLFDPDGATSFVKVRPLAPSTQAQFLTALVPVNASSWANRPRIDALAAADVGAGAVVAPGSALEERWIFSRAGSDGKAAGDLALTSALAGVVGRDASGAVVRAALFGPGKLSDQGGTRELLSSASARAIEAQVRGSTLIVTGAGIADFRAFAPAATAVSVNGAAVAVDFAAGVVSWPVAGAPSGAGPADGGTSAAPAVGAVSGASVVPVTAGCTTASIEGLWPALLLLPLVFRRRRAGRP